MMLSFFITIEFNYTLKAESVCEALLFSLLKISNDKCCATKLIFFT